jgi:glucose/arabinose dehydrogenase
MVDRPLLRRWVGITSLGLLLAAAAAPALVVGRAVRGSDISLPASYQVEAIATDLAAPTMVAFDDQRRMLIAESGYDGSGPARVTRIESDGTRTTLAEVPADEAPLTAVAFNEGSVYYVSATTVWRIGPDGVSQPVIGQLPGQGDHQANQIVFLDGRIYVAVGTATNSAVVGPDNAIFGWLKMPARREVHDIPCEDVAVADVTFESDNPFGDGTVQTSPYAAFGTVLPAGSVVPGDVRCNGAILSAALDGSDLRVEAWGLRNPYGLEVGPDGAIYFVMHGDDARGSRPIENAPDCLYRLEPGAWYGWPDFACDVPVTDPRFRPPNGIQPGFVLARHPTDTPPAPIATFAPHAAANGFAFTDSVRAYVALFGDATPATGTVDRPAGVEVVQVDTTTGAVTSFMKNVIPGEATEHLLGGLEHPSDVTVGPDNATYVTDWGAFRDTLDGIKIEPRSGVVWRVERLAGPFDGYGPPPTSGGVLQNIVLTLALAALAVLAAIGRRRVMTFARGAVAGVIGALAMGVFTMFIASPILQLPWFGTPRVLATTVLGRTAVADIVHFEPVSFVVGTVVLLVLGSVLGIVFSLLARSRNRLRIVAAGLLFGLAVWSAAQWLVLPALFPLISDKGLPPAWLAASLAVLGVVLGLVAAWFVRPATQERTSRPWQDVSP